jgi:hypothetical protein
MQDLSSKIQLQFHCQQEVSEMKPSADGKPFCSQCQRSLMDFRGRPLKEVNAYVRQNEGCGIFDPLHIQPESETSPLFLFSECRKYLFAFLTFLFTEQVYAQGEAPIVITQEEPSIRWGNNMVLHAEYKKKKEEEGRNRAQEPSKEEVEKKVTRQKSKSLKSSPRKYRYGVFVYKKFPFVRFRQRIILRSHGGFWKVPNK